MNKVELEIIKRCSANSDPSMFEQLTAATGVSRNEPLLQTDSLKRVLPEICLLEFERIVDSRDAALRSVLMEITPTINPTKPFSPQLWNKETDLAHPDISRRIEIALKQADRRFFIELGEALRREPPQFKKTDAADAFLIANWIVFTFQRPGTATPGLCFKTDSIRAEILHLALGNIGNLSKLAVRKRRERLGLMPVLNKTTPHLFAFYRAFRRTADKRK